MFNGKTAVAIVAAALLITNACLAQTTLEDSWNSFLSDLRANRLDSAKVNAQAVLGARPEPVQLLALIAGKPEDNATIIDVNDTTSDTALAELTRQILLDIEEGRVNTWGDFLHYTKIGRFDMAKGNAQLLLDSDPDPVVLLELSSKNPQGYQILVKVNESAPDAQMTELSGKILALIERGRFIQRTAPKIIAEEVRRLSTTDRGWFVAVERLRNAGEYAIPFMLDAMTDPGRESELSYVIRALPHIGKDAIRPLAAALQTNNVPLKAEIITALGKISYPQALPYLKYIIENEDSAELRGLAQDSIRQINPGMLSAPAAQLFYDLAEQYYYHTESLQPVLDANFGNVWFWNADEQKLEREEVAREYFNELMTMRTCEWALKADAGFGTSIGLWLAAFFKAESTGIGQMPEYFGEGHADALVYATTAGVEYLHQALARAVKDKNAYVALGIIEALATTAGEESLMYQIGPSQPVLQALTFDDRKVRYSAAIAIAAAGPKESFNEVKLVTSNLAEALGQTPQQATTDGNGWDAEAADSYALRAAQVLLSLAQTRNPVINLSAAQDTLESAVRDKRTQIQILAAQTLAHFDSPGAQRAIAAMALDTNNSAEVQISGFDSLALSAKLNANMLPDEVINGIYSLINSGVTDPALRSAAAAAYGALNLPSQKVKDLILDQAKS